MLKRLVSSPDPELSQLRMDYITSSVALRNVGLGTRLSPRLVVVSVSSVRAITIGVKEECTNSQMHAHFLGNRPPPPPPPPPFFKSAFALEFDCEISLCLVEGDGLEMACSMEVIKRRFIISDTVLNNYFRSESIMMCFRSVFKPLLKLLYALLEALNWSEGEKNHSFKLKFQSF